MFEKAHLCTSSTPTLLELDGYGVEMESTIMFRNILLISKSRSKIHTLSDSRGHNLQQAYNSRRTENITNAHGPKQMAHSDSQSAMKLGTRQEQTSEILATGSILQRSCCTGRQRCWQSIVPGL